MKRYKNLLTTFIPHPRSKRRGPFGVILFTLLIAATAYILVQYHATLMTDRREKTKRFVEKTIGIISYYHMKVEQGELSEPLARQYALESIKKASTDKPDYFWVTDTQPSMIMHPTRPNMDGMDLTEYTGTMVNCCLSRCSKLPKTAMAGFLNICGRSHLMTKRFSPKYRISKISSHGDGSSAPDFMSMMYANTFLTPLSWSAAASSLFWFSCWLCGWVFRNLVRKADRLPPSITPHSVFVTHLVRTCVI